MICEKIQQFHFSEFLLPTSAKYKQFLQVIALISAPLLMSLGITVFQIQEKFIHQNENKAVRREKLQKIKQKLSNIFSLQFREIIHQVRRKMDFIGTLQVKLKALHLVDPFKDSINFFKELQY